MWHFDWHQSKSSPRYYGWYQRNLRIIRDYFEKLCSNKLENLEEMDSIFLIYQKISHLSIGNLLRNYSKQSQNYLGINLTIKVKRSLKWNLNKAKIEENTDRWKDLLYSWIERITVVKMTILPRALCRFNAISIKISMTLLTELEKNLTIHTKVPKSPNSQSNLEQIEQI
jgi:hypothetical protein